MRFAEVGVYLDRFLVSTDGRLETFLRKVQNPELQMSFGEFWVDRQSLF